MAPNEELDGKALTHMTSTDKDGLSLSQIRRIDRLKMSRHRKRANNDNRAIKIFVGAMYCSALVILISALLRYRPTQTELYTRLPADLDQQAPSITVYGN